MKTNYKVKLLLLISFVFYTLHGQKLDNKNIKQDLLKNIFENPDLVIKNTTLLIKETKNIQDIVGYYIIMSDAYVSKREYSKALTNLEEASILMPKDNSVETQYSLLKLNNKIASLYYQMSMYEKAISQIEAYYSKFDILPKVDSITLIKGSTTALKGLIYREKLGCKIALPYFEDALAIYKNINSKASKINSSIVYYNYAKCYLELNNYELAKKYHTISFELGSQVGKGSLQAYPLKGLANVYIKQNNYATALDYLLQAEEISKDVGDRILKNGIYTDISEIYLKLGDKKNFILYNSKATIEGDLVKKSQLNYITSSLNSILKQENQDLQSNKEKFNYKLYSTIFIVSFICIILCIVIFSLLKKIKKMM